MTKGRRKSKVPSQESTIVPVDEGPPLESDDEGGAPAAAAAAAPAGKGGFGQ